MMSFRPILPLLLLLNSLLLAKVPELLLADRGKALADIAVPADASPVDQFAARELKLFLDRITGADFKIVQNPGRKSICIGRTGASELADQENIIEIAGDRLHLYGGGVHGNLYAVYELLENCFGCVFLNAYGDLHIPRQTKLTLSTQKRRTKYAFPARAIMNYFYRDKTAVTLAFYRNRQNLLLHSYQQPRYPGKEKGIVALNEIFLSNHSLSRLIPPGGPRTGRLKGFLPPLPFLKDKNYFQEHPEYFSLDENGKRVPDRQLCFTNPGLRLELEKNIRNFYDQEHRRTGLAGIISLDCNDIAYRMCYCPECSRLMKKYHTPGAPLYDFAVTLAERNPDIPIRIMAYQRSLTQIPPDNPRPWPRNLSLITALINGDFLRPLNQGEINRRDLKDLLGWSSITKDILVWYYPHPYNRSREQFFTEPPVSALQRTAADLKIMREAGIAGPYVEFDSGGVMQCTNFSELEIWVLFKLFQNPDLDYKKLAEKFIRLYYGDVPEIQRYYSELSAETDRIRQTKESWNYRTIQASYLTSDNLRRWDGYLDRAQKKTGGEKAFRIRLLRIGLDTAVVALLDDHSAERISRLRDTLKELEKKRPVSIPWKRFDDWVKNMENRGHRRPLPERFASVPGTVVLDVPSRKKSVITCKHANLGNAFEQNWDKNGNFRLGVYDKIRKVIPASALFTREQLTSSEFKWHRITTRPLKLTRPTIIFGGNWWLSFPVGEKCCPQDDPEALQQLWHIWVAIKTDGNKILCDQAVAVPQLKKE